MATKRILRKPTEIRKLIEESGLKYIMVNNRIFDDFLEKGEGCYTLKKVKCPFTKEDKYIDHNDKEYDFCKSNNEFKTTFDERDLIIFIFLKFLDAQGFNGYQQEIADYLGYSNKRLKLRLKKLEFLQGNVNNTYNHSTNEREIYKTQKKTRLINEEQIKGWENGKRKTVCRWHVDFDCDYKQEADVSTGELKDIPENFFMVSIYELDLFTSGKLNEKEFITYLYLIRAFDSKRNTGIYHRVSVISNKINIKDSSITEKILYRLANVRVRDVFCEDGEDLPLICVNKPGNFSNKILIREEPSYLYNPIYNRTTLQKIEDAKEDASFMDTDTINKDAQFFIDDRVTNKDEAYSF